MNRQGDPNDDTDKLLDRIVTQLRDQAVPAMPNECAEFDPTTGLPCEANRQNHVRRNMSVLLAVAALVLAVASVFYVANRANDIDRRTVEQSNLPEDGIHPEKSDGIIAFELSSRENLIAMDVGLDEIESEIAQLRRQAELLDARRRAAELLGSMAMIE